MSDLDAKLRAWWFQRQGLDGAGRGWSAAETLARTGWARSVGGSNPYLSLLNRAGITKAGAEAALAQGEILELPSARGCTYFVPQDDFALARKVAETFGDTGDLNTAIKFLGVTMTEVEQLCDSVVAALQGGPLEPSQLKKELGAQVRNLGEDGRKRGQTTTLPLALGRLQIEGRIRRQPVNGRLDQQKFRYAAWTDAPEYLGTRQEAFQELTAKYWQWIGPASIAQFRWFSGLGMKAGSEAVAALDLVEIPETDLLLERRDLAEWDEFVPPAELRVALVSSLDGIALLRRDVPSLIDAADRERQVLGEKGMVQMGLISDLVSNAILDRGRVIGLWEFDPDTSLIASLVFDGDRDRVQPAIDSMQHFIAEELGDCRSFSLDSPASRRPLIEFLRKGSS